MHVLLQEANLQMTNVQSRLPHSETRNPSVAAILEALSQALDITEGQPRGHAVRTCMISTRIAKQLDLSPADQESVFYASLLKDAGCSTNSARIHKVFGGDELLAKHNVKFVDWSNPLKSVAYAISNTAVGEPKLKRLGALIAMIGPPTQVMDEVTAARCFRGADIATQLGFDRGTSEAIRHLDEHWDGKGSPTHAKGDQIPILARILGLAQTLEVFVNELGLQAGLDMIRARSKRWFDPEVVQATLALENDTQLWAELAAQAKNPSKGIPPSEGAVAANEVDIDDVCKAFASIIDAKSSFTGEHSERVTQYCVAIARAQSDNPERIRTLRRSALLHDIGKLGVPNNILDKPGKLTDDEFRRVQEHPRHSYEIISCIDGFDRIANIAACHHERLDGKGYWRGLGADDLDMDMRILATADVFDALTADRPYRSAMDPVDAINLMESNSCGGLDPCCVGILRDIGPSLVSASREKSPAFVA
ncbi:HD domain-containing protein [soil metagenome]